MEEEISIKDLLLAMWRKKLIIIFVTLIFLILGIILFGMKKDEENINEVENSNIAIDDDKDNSSSNTEIKYIGTNFVFARGVDKVVDGVTNTYKIAITDGIIKNLNSFSKSKNFLENVLNEINSQENIDNLQENINIFGNDTSDVLTLIVALENEEDALKITNKVIEHLTEMSDKIYQINEIITIDGPREITKKKFEELQEANIVPDEEESEVQVVQEENTSSPKKKIILVTLIGFILSCGIVVSLEIFSSSVKDEENLEKMTNLKVLVKIPKTKLDLTDKFELLRVKINGCKTILVTSSENKDGKSFVAINLAKACARFGNKVLLTDTKVLSSDNDLYDDMSESSVKNLTTNLSDDDYEDEPIKVSDSKIEERLKNLNKNYDLVIIDSNNVLDSANTLAISKYAEYTAIVSSERKTKIPNIIKAKNNIEDIGGNVIGHILNNTKK